MGADPLQAIASPRLHSQLLPDVVGAETHSILGANFYVPGTALEVIDLAWLAFLMVTQLQHLAMLSAGPCTAWSCCPAGLLWSCCAGHFMRPSAWCLDWGQ